VGCAADGSLHLALCLATSRAWCACFPSPCLQQGAIQAIPIRCHACWTYLRHEEAHSPGALRRSLALHLTLSRLAGHADASTSACLCSQLPTCCWISTHCCTHTRVICRSCMARCCCKTLRVYLNCMAPGALSQLSRHLEYSQGYQRILVSACSCLQLQPVIIRGMPGSVLLPGLQAETVTALAENVSYDHGVSPLPCCRVSFGCSGACTLRLCWHLCMAPSTCLCGTATRP
jgi:hypothetical protein